MLKNRDIIIFALARHDGIVNISTSFTIAKLLAKNNRVLYVDDPYTYKSVLMNLSKPELKNRLKHYVPLVNGLDDWTDGEVSLKILTLPPTIPINMLNPGKTYDRLLKLNTWFVGNRIQRTMKYLGFEKVIYINSFNFYYPGIEKYISPSLYVYHCIDGMIKPYTLRHGPRLESMILKEADAVISTSPALQRAKGKLNPRSYLSTNAADFSHFHKATLPETPVAKEIIDLPHPIIGFYGNIERRINFDLLMGAAKLRPAWNFLMIGSIEEEWMPKEMRQIPNMIFHPKQPYSRLPEFLKGMDVAMIPYKVDEISSTIYPLKLFEYLSAGKAVISTSFNTEVIDITKGVSFIADTPEEFADSMDKALASNTEDNIRLRMEIAQENTWEHKENEFGEHIEKLLEELNRT